MNSIPWTRRALIGATLSALIAGCGGGSSGGPSAPKTETARNAVALWKPIVGADAPAVPLPPAAGSPQLQSEIAQLLELQSARTPAQIALFDAWNGQTASRWNAIARALIISHSTPPPLASRAYAALGVAQFDAAIAAARQQKTASARLDARLQPLGESDGYPSLAAAICAASAATLKNLYPDSATLIERNSSDCQSSRLIGGVSLPADLSAGAAIGDAIAARVASRIAGDHSAEADQALPVPKFPGSWPGEHGLLPRWKNVTPWLTTDITRFRAPAPPAFGSADFNAGLAEVRQISDNRSAEQSQIAEFWADAAQTFTPPGHWNLFAEKIIESHDLDEAHAARVYALLGMASEDAGISCWDAKFNYWLLRPSQADPQITTPIGLPNFPSYTSGHSAFSGAAAQVLGALFPDEKSVVDSLATEASVSRVYGGIHYRFDAAEGLKSGRAVADLAVARAHNDGASQTAPAGMTLSRAQLKAATQAQLNRRAPGGGARQSANWD